MEGSRQMRATVAALTWHIRQQRQTHMRSIQLLQQAVQQAPNSRQAAVRTASSSRQRSRFWTFGQQQVHLAVTHISSDPSLSV